MSVRASALLALALAAGCARPPRPPPVEDAAAPRIVSLAPSLTETLFAVGAGGQLVGRTDVCNWPPEVMNLPVAGGFGRPSLETMLALRPTLVLSADLEDAHALDALNGTGIARRQVPCRNLDEIPSAIRTVGSLTGRTNEAARLASDIEARLAALRRERLAVTNAPCVFVEIWGDPLMTAGRRSFVSELVTLAGGRNLGDEVDTDYCTVSSEWVVGRDPDVILCLYMAGDTHAHLRAAARPGWQALRAVRAGRVYDGFDTDVMLRPGPRVLDGIEALRRAIARPAPPPAGR